MISEEVTGRFLPILIYIQTHLDSNLSLEILADQAGLTPFHFHRKFQLLIGETPKKYTQRLRLERAAFELKIRDAPILTIALNTGFHSHEVFTRAFKKHFGLTPHYYRKLYAAAKLNERRFEKPFGKSLNQLTVEFQISPVRVEKLKGLPVSFIRHDGDYSEVDPMLFEKLIRWARKHGVYTGGNLLIGIGHDDPAITPADKLRYDACIEVPEQIQPGHEIGFQVTPDGWFAAVTYVGPYGHVMREAYLKIFQKMMDLNEFRLIGLPAMEIYRTTHINPDYSLNETDIYLPIHKIEGV